MFPPPHEPHDSHGRRAGSTVRRLAASIVTFALLVSVLPGSVALADEDPVRLLVTYDEPVRSDVTAADVTAADVTASDVTTTTATTDVTTAGVSGIEVVEGDGAASRVQLVDAPDRATAARVRDRLEKLPGVARVEEDVRVHAHSGLAWGVHNEGQAIAGVPGTPGIDIGAAQAWSTATGRGTVVAVLDTGVDITHPLLRDRIWRNPSELANARDDDRNGYVDDLHGWDFTTDTPDVSARVDGDVHATHIAGVIAGDSDPATGFRGVAPDARIMVLRFIDDDGAGWTSDAVRALRYAAENGADVVNLSFGGHEPSLALRTAIAEAGIPVVTSAGNEGQSHDDMPIYPAAFDIPNQLTVAAVDHTGALARFSSYGRRTVDVVAPGEQIVSTVPGGLASLSGTSMAAPFVAGALALAVDHAPGAGTDELLAAVRHSSRPLTGAAETRTGALVRAGGLLEEVGAPVPVCRREFAPAFADVGQDHTHVLGVQCLVAAGVTSGVTSTRFGAELGLTRAHVATLVANSLSAADLRPATPSSSVFRDLDGNMHRDNIEALASVGILESPTARYGPATVVSRAEFAGIVARAAEYAAGAPSRTSGPAFADIADSPHRDGIEVASALSLVAGRSPGVFDPLTAVRRDQAATMLVNLLDRLHHHGQLAPM